MADLPRTYRNFQKAYKEVADAHELLGKAAAESGPLDAKTMELPIPNHLKKWWFCLGGTVLYLFIVQVLTGIALTFYYVPTPEDAYARLGSTETLAGHGST